METHRTSARLTAALLRVSTSKQDTDIQRAACINCAERRGYAIDRFYEETVSGASLNRPELDNLLNDVRSGIVGEVFVARLDRIARSLSQAMRVLDVLKEHKAALFTADGFAFDLASPMGEFLYGQLSVVAQFERSLIRARTGDGIAEYVANGGKLGNPSLVWSPEDDAHIIAAIQSGKTWDEAGADIRVALSRGKATRRPKASSVRKRYLELFRLGRAPKPPLRRCAWTVPGIPENDPCAAPAEDATFPA